MSGVEIEALPDRWIVRARGAHLEEISSETGRLLNIAFDTGLKVRVEGTWKATQGSPVTGTQVLQIDVGKCVGSRILSFVLFDAGSVRLVLSDGLTIVARSTEGTRISSGLAGVFEWMAAHQEVTRWHAEQGE